jgi:hypothetical protein
MIQQQQLIAPVRRVKARPQAISYDDVYDVVRDRQPACVPSLGSNPAVLSSNVATMASALRQVFLCPQILLVSTRTPTETSVWT